MRGQPRLVICGAKGRLLWTQADGVLGIGKGATVWRWKVLSPTLPIHKEALGHCPACLGPSLKDRALEPARGMAFCSKAAAAARSTCLAGPQPGCSWLPALPYGDVHVPGDPGQQQGLERSFRKFRLCFLCESEGQLGGVQRTLAFGVRQA